MSTQPVCGKCGGTGWIIIERASVSASNLASAATSAVPTGSKNDRRYLPSTATQLRKLQGWHHPGTQTSHELRQGVRRQIPQRPLPRPAPHRRAWHGETHLAVAALRRIIQKGYEGVFMDYQTFLDRIRRGYDATSNASDKEAYRTALDCEVLLLDDLGAHRGTDRVQDTVTSIVTHRCNHRKRSSPPPTFPTPTLTAR